MKAKRLLFLVMVICLASGMKAQFYDGPDDIYYYVEEYYEYPESKWGFEPYIGYHYVETGNTQKKYPEKGHEKVLVFNFDGKKAAELGGFATGQSLNSVKQNLRQSPTYYEDKVENTDYTFEYNSSYYAGIAYTRKPFKTCYNYIFSFDRNKLTESWVVDPGSSERKRIYKRVDKSFFKVGRSRTPSGTLHE